MAGVLRYTVDGVNWIDLQSGPKGDTGDTGPQGPPGVSGGKTTITWNTGTGTNTDVDPGVGKIVQSGTTTNRVFAASKTDATGVVRNLELLGPGDGWAVLWDVDGQAPYSNINIYTIKQIIDNGAWVQITGTRTANTGSNNLNTTGSPNEIVLDLGGQEYYVRYEDTQLVKGGPFNSLATTFTPFVTLDCGELPAGSYVYNISVSWISTDVGTTLVLRDQFNDGTWSVYAQQADTNVYWRNFGINYPLVHPGGPVKIDLEGKRESTTPGVIDVKYVDMWISRVT